MDNLASDAKSGKLKTDLEKPTGVTTYGVHLGNAFVYPLVNIQKTMENHHFQWENPLFQWSCSIAMLNYQRVIVTTYV